jgi:hypothetical protein
MSLKFFHILFITVSTLLAFAFAGWELTRYFRGANGAVDLLLGLASVVAGIGLVIYGKYVFAKLKKIS